MSRRRRFAVLVVLVIVGAAVVIWHTRVVSDFWPPDRSFVGPNLVASAVLAVGAIVKVRGIHAKLDTRRQHDEWVARQIARMHEHVTGEPSDRHPHHPDIGGGQR